jgi:hypothetical protein
MKRVGIDCKERFPDYYLIPTATVVVDVQEEQLQRWLDVIATYNRVQAEIKEAFIASKIAKTKRGSHDVKRTRP